MSGNKSLDISPPFLPLEESMRSKSGTDTESSLDDVQMESGEFDADTVEAQVLSPSSTSKKNDDESLVASSASRRRSENNSTTFSAVSPTVSFLKKVKLPSTKQVVLAAVGLFFAFILWECFFVQPDDRLIKPDFSDKFLTWVQSNPGWGLGAILIVIAAAVVSLVPIGTPLTLGCGYIYRGVYGWKLGLLVSTVVSMAGSTLGAVTCFLLGRYLMRDTVKRWVRNYPMFDAIDVGKIYQLFIRCLRTSEMKLKLGGPIKKRETLLTLPFFSLISFAHGQKSTSIPGNSCFQARTENHGYALPDTCATARTRKLYVRYDGNGLILFCCSKNCILAVVSYVYFYGSVGPFVHQREKWRDK